MSDYYDCSECGEHLHRKSEHECPGRPEDRIAALELRLEILEEALAELQEALAELRLKVKA